MRVCYQLARLRGKELLKTFSRYHKATVYKYGRKPISTVKTPEYRRKLNIGKARKLDERQKTNKAINFKSTCHCRVIYFNTGATGSWLAACIKSHSTKIHE